MHAGAPKQGSPIMIEHGSDIVYFVTESVYTFYKLCQESLEVQCTQDRCTCRGEMEKGKTMKREREYISSNTTAELIIIGQQLQTFNSSLNFLT